MRKGYTMSEVAIVLIILFVLGYMLSGFLSNLGNMLKHPQCFFSKDPVLCTILIEKEK